MIVLIIAASVMFAGLVFYKSIVMFGFAGLIVAFITSISAAIYALRFLPETTQTNQVDHTQSAIATDNDPVSINPSAEVCDDSCDLSAPIVNIDGTLMVGDFDINGNMYGVTSHNFGFDD